MTPMHYAAKKSTDNLKSLLEAQEAKARQGCGVGGGETRETIGQP
jgi:hypothetical protein